MPAPVGRHLRMKGERQPVALPDGDCLVAMAGELLHIG